jgi:hypothetical protein
MVVSGQHDALVALSVGKEPQDFGCFGGEKNFLPPL